MDGKPSIILGLIWTIILQYHVSLFCPLSIFLFSFSTHRDKTSIHCHDFKPFAQSLNITAWKVQHKLCVAGVVRSRSWPAASRSAPVSPPWSLWPVWTLAPACRAARPAAVPFLPAARRYTTDSECLPRRPCCSGSGNSATSKTGSTEWCYWANIHPVYLCCAGLTEGCHVDTSACQSLRKSSHGAARLLGAKCVMLGGKYPHTGTSWFCPGLGWRPEPDHSLTVWAEGVCFVFLIFVALMFEYESRHCSTAAQTANCIMTDPY